MRIAVTGGAGFLGSHLVHRFLDQGHQVIAIDNLITGSQKNLSHPRAAELLSFILLDVTEGIQIDGPLDAIFHFASPASPADFDRFPIQILKAGALGTHKALGLAKKKDALFVLASTSEVYGDPTVHPQPETYWGNVNPIGPRGVYDEAKRYAEAMTMAYHRTHGVSTRIARIFNTYGPRMRLDDGRLIPNLMRQVLTEQPLTIYGDGNQTRSFGYVDDVVVALTRLLDTDFAEPINIGSDQEFSVNEVVEMLQAMLPHRLEVNYLPAAADDPKCRRPLLDRAKQYLDWAPETDLQTGLRKTLDYFLQLDR